MMDKMIYSELADFNLFKKFMLYEKIVNAVMNYILEHADYPDAIFMSTRAAEEAGLEQNDLIVTVPIFISPHMEPDNEIMIIKTTAEAKQGKVELGIAYPGEIVSSDYKFTPVITS